MLGIGSFVGMWGVMAALCGAAVFFSASPIYAGELQQREMQAAIAQLMAHYDAIALRMGPASAADLQERLNTDLGAMLADEPPPGYPPQDWHDRLNDLAKLDASIVAQVVAGKSDSLGSAHGAVERLLVTRTDHTLQPYALYVPSTLAPSPALVVLLHGNPQTEAEIMASPYFRKLADETGTIVAAPYGRAIYNFAAPADDEVYQMADEVGAAFHIAPGRTYLAGYSMGGFSVFKVAPEHPERWAGVMSIAGAIYFSEANGIVRALQRKPLYVITGTQDDSIPTTYPQRSATYLASAGVPTGLYVQPKGTHLLATLMPVLDPAWHDMLAGRIPANLRPNGQTQLPTTMPMPPGRAQES
jgi:pimeloyl-ACP methyl ester carboxylesterase